MLPITSRRALLGGAFSPLSIPGLKLWLDASKIVGLVDGDPVGTWSDLSGQGNHATQGTGSKKPTYKTGIINARPVVRGDGVDDLMVLPNFSSAAQGGVWIVYSLATLTSSRELFTSADEATTGAYWICRGTTSGAGRATLAQRNADTEDNVLATTTTLTTNQPCIAYLGSTGSSYLIRENGVVQSLTVAGGANSGDWWAATAGRDNFALFALKRTAEADQLAGDIAEVIVGDQAYSTAQITQVEHYLGAKYGITVS